ncbi:MAG: L,D-transpeptidase [Chloroflexota bacterium]|nr:L,D-transpeptidase [Chloroflexota bacterium]
MRWCKIIVWLVILLITIPAELLRAAPGDADPSLFADSLENAYLCTFSLTQRHPERCPTFSPGARTVHIEYLRAKLPDPLPELPVEELEKPEGAISNYTFAYVNHLPAPSYAHPLEAEQGLPPQRIFYDGSNWVSILGRVEYNGEVWYQINADEFVRTEHIAIVGPSRFQGVKLQATPEYPFAWVLNTAQTSSLPGGPAEGRTYYRYERVTLFAQDRQGEELWYLIGPDQWLEQRNVARVDVHPRPEGVQPGDKWIEINTFEQTLAAYDGDQIVYATLVSSGRPGETWTPDGLTRIWGKIISTPMTNPDDPPEAPEWYYLEDVEWTQYFFEAYALHAAYWHDSFGFTRSHGCVNLTPLDSQWLFNWTTPQVVEGTAPGSYTYLREAGAGTWVWIHKTSPLAEE